MAAKCRKFEPNVFNKTKCGVCFKSRNDHSASALESAKAARKLMKYGYLFIAPDISARRWQRRFFVLYDDGELSYSVDENADTVPQGVIDMNSCEEVFDAEQLSGHEFSFGITVPPETHYIKGTSREEATRWMELLAVYPAENAENRTTARPNRSASQDVLSTRPHRENTELERSGSDHQTKNELSTGVPMNSSTRQRTKSSPQISQYEFDDELTDKFLKEDWYKPINNNQSSLGDLNAKPRHRRHTATVGAETEPERDLTRSDSLHSEPKSSLSSRQTTGLSAADRPSLAKSRRRTQPEIRFEPAVSAPDVQLEGRRRGSSDVGRVEAPALSATEGAPGGPPPAADKARERTTNASEVEGLPEMDETSNRNYMKKGWLHKLTPNGEWSKHWFVLCGQALKYYRDSRAEDINDLDGRIDLKYCLDVREVDVSKNYGMQIRNRNGTYTISAMTSGIRSNWIHALRKFVIDEPEPERRSRRRNTVPEVLPADLHEARTLAEVSPPLVEPASDRSQLVVEGRSDDRPRQSEDRSSRRDSVTSDGSDRWPSKDHQLTAKQDPKHSGKSPIEKKLDKLRSKAVVRSRSPPPKLASEVLKKAGESPDHGAVVHMLESEVDHLQNQLEKAHDEMVSLHDENSRLKSKFKHAKKRIKEAEESSQLALHDDQARAASQTADNIDEKAVLKLELDNVRHENDLLHVKIRKLTDENATLKRSFQAVTNENTSLSTDLNTVQTQLTKLQEANLGKHDELTELVQRVEDYRNESRKHKKSCREKDNQILELSEELQHKCEDYEDLSRKYNTISGEVDKMKNVKAFSVKLERENNNLKQEMDQKNRNYSDVMNRYNELASEYQNLKSSVEGTKKITSNYVTNLKEYENLIKHLRQELENRTIDLTANEKQKSTLETELKDAKMTLKDSLHILDSQKSRVDEKDKQITDLKKSLEEGNYERDELMNKYEDLLSKYNHLVQTSASGEAGQKGEISKLHELLDERIHAYDLLENKYNDLLCSEKAHDLSLLDQLDDRDEEVEKLKEEINERTDDCEELALRVDQLEKELANTRMALMERDSGKPIMVDNGCSPALGEGRCSVSVQTTSLGLCTSACQTDSPSACQACVDSIPLLDKLEQEARDAEQRAQELDARNAALKLQINQMMDRYQGEVKMYAEKIDYLEEKMRSDKETKHDSLETLLTGLEKQIENAENAMQRQATVEDTLAQGLTELLDDQSSETNTERMASPDLDEPVEAVKTLDQQEFDDELLTRIQNLHNRVAVSNEKLSKLISLHHSQTNDSESSSEVMGRLRSFEERLSSVQSHIVANETRTATTESLMSLMDTHAHTLSVLDECENGLMTSLSSLNKSETRRDKLQALVVTVNEMMEFANRERQVILDNKKLIEEALKLPDRDRNLQETAALQSAVQVQASQEMQFITERNQYFAELQEATKRISELEETVDYLRSTYSQSSHKDVLLNLSDAVETYANVIAEGVVHHGIAEVTRQVHTRARFCERDGLVHQVQTANTRIRQLENTVELQMSDREKLIKAQSFNHYVSLLNHQTDHQEAMFKDYRDNLVGIRRTQMNEFTQFSDRLKSIEDKIGTLLLGRAAAETDEVTSSVDHVVTPSVNEDCSIFGQAACLVGRALGQAELVLKLHHVRDQILSCSSKQDQLKMLNHEIDLSVSRLQNREKLMTDSVDKYKSHMLENVSKLVVKHGVQGLSLSESIQALVGKLNGLVDELCIFYKSMDMPGERVELQRNLESCLDKEMELASHELQQKCFDKSSDVAGEPLTQELFSSLMYNLADLLAQRAMVEAQFQFVTDVHRESKNYMLPVSTDSPSTSRPPSVPTSLSTEEDVEPVHEAAPPVPEVAPTLALAPNDRRQSDILETNVASSYPGAPSRTSTSSDPAHTNPQHQHLQHRQHRQHTSHLTVDLRRSELHTASIASVDLARPSESVADLVDCDDVFSMTGDNLDRDTADVFHFSHDPDAAPLTDPDLGYNALSSKRRTASASDLVDAEPSSDILDLTGNEFFTSLPDIGTAAELNTGTQSLTQSRTSKSIIAARMRAAEAKNRLHRSPAFRRRERQSKSMEPEPDTITKSVTRTARPPPSSSQRATPPRSSPSEKKRRSLSTPDISASGKPAHSTPRASHDTPKKPVYIPHSETRKVYVKSLRKPPPLKRGSPPKPASPKKNEDRFVVSFGLSRGPVPETTNDIF